MLPLPSRGSRHDRKNQELIDALFEDDGKIKVTLSHATHDSFTIVLVTLSIYKYMLVFKKM